MAQLINFNATLAVNKSFVEKLARNQRIKRFLGSENFADIMSEYDQFVKIDEDFEDYTLTLSITIDGKEKEKQE